MDLSLTEVFDKIIGYLGFLTGDFIRGFLADLHPYIGSAFVSIFAVLLTFMLVCFVIKIIVELL